MNGGGSIRVIADVLANSAAVHLRAVESRLPSGLGLRFLNLTHFVELPLPLNSLVTDHQLVRPYHYLEAKWAIDDIKRCRLKTSAIDDLNDPYEFEYVSSIDLLTQVALDKTKSEFEFGLTCFSRSWNNVLMWSNYADKHKGMCLGFDVSDDILRPVEYAPKPEIIDSMVVENEKDFSVERGEALVNRLLHMKYEGWQ